MSEENGAGDPPQTAYFIAFGLAIVLLGITMFKYPLWALW
jgi:hypothetical protein